MFNITNQQGIQIKTATIYHLTPVNMAIIKKQNMSWRGCGEKGTFVHYWLECTSVQQLRKTIWKFLKTLKIELSSSPTLGIYPKEITHKLEYHLALWKKEILSVVTTQNTDEPRGHYKWNKSDRKTNITLSHLYVKSSILQ